MNSQGSWSGQYTDGQTAQVHNVVVRLDGLGLRFARAGSGEVMGTWPLADLIFDDSFSGIVRISTKGVGDAALTVPGPEFRAALGQVGAMSRPKNRYLLLVGLVAVIASAGVGFYFSVDPLSKAIAAKIPMSLEYKMKDSFASQFTKNTCSTPASAQATAALLQRLAGPDSKIDFDVRISDDKLVNAFALPGGVIYLTKGLLEKAEGPDEVAGILAHEMEHIRRRHIMTGLVRSALLTGVWRVMFGDFSGVLVVDPATAYQLVSLKYGRDAEAEADQGALKTLDRAAVSRDGFAEFFKRLEKEGGNIPVDILSSHPGNDKRLAMIATGKGAVKPKPALPDNLWRDLKDACASKTIPPKAGRGPAPEPPTKP